MKSSHTFNLLDARGAISVTERAAYIGRVRALARAVAQAYYESRERLGFPDAARTQPSMEATLLVELLTEELPPKALRALGRAFAQRHSRRAGRRWASSPKTGKYEQDLATPRRLAVLIADVAERAASEESRGHRAVGQRAAGRRSPGFAKKHGVAVDGLSASQAPKGEVFVARVKAGGAVLDEVLAGVVERALKKLPIPKVMRWGDGDAQFVRPVHGLVMLHGARVVPGTVLGTRRRQRARRAIASWARARSRSPARTTTSAAARRRQRDRRLRRAHARDRARSSRAGRAPATPDARRATRTCSTKSRRWSSTRASTPARFDADVPGRAAGVPDPHHAAEPEVLSAVRPRGKLLPRFLIVSNMQVADPRHIIGGNERVVRPRLADARFFYDQDRKTRLEARVPQLAQVVYHNKLGTPARARRAHPAAGGQHRARRSAPTPAAAERAAWLSKADLLTGMVGEFPELQGVMGRYYALHDGEPRRGRRRDRGALPAALRRRPAARGPGRLRASRSPTSSMRSPACSASASSRPATRIRSACAAPRSAWSASWSSASCRFRLHASCVGADGSRSARRFILERFARLPAGAGLLDAARSTRCSARARRGSIWCRGSSRRCAPSRRCPRPRASPRRTSASQHPEAGGGQGRVVRQRPSADAEGARGAGAVRRAARRRPRTQCLCTSGRLHRLPEELRGAQGAGRRVLRQGHGDGRGRRRCATTASRCCATCATR